MFSSMVEGVLQRIAGRYLKNFGPQNVSVSVTGTITLTNVQIRTEELINFQLPYKPVRAFIGSLHLDLPLVMSSSFDVRISDVLFVIERNAENIALDAATAHKALQMWIGAFYFSLLHAESMKRDISSSELEYSQRLLERLSVSVQGLHVRIEEVFTAHVPCPIGRELMTLGLIVGKLEFRPPSSQEVSDSDVFTHAPTSAHLVINKLVEAQDLSVYCYREEPLGNIADEDLTLELVRSHCYLRKAGTVFGPVSLSLNFSGTYNKATQVFGPVILHASAGGLDVRANDEQMAFISAMVHLFERNVYVLQQRSRVGLCELTSAGGVGGGGGGSGNGSSSSSSSGGSSSNSVGLAAGTGASSSSSGAGSEVRRRARYRWGLLRTAIKMDWTKYASALHEGSIRWRAWFETWVLVSRYLALREVLLYHVGFEASSEGRGAEESVSYGINESLLLDHQSDREGRDRAPTPTPPPADGEDPAAAMARFKEASGRESRETKRMRRRYQGKGAFSLSIMQAAEVLVRQQQRFDGDGISPLSLSASAVRALYALQLEVGARVVSCHPTPTLLPPSLLHPTPSKTLSRPPSSPIFPAPSSSPLPPLHSLSSLPSLPSLPSSQDGHDSAGAGVRPGSPVGRGALPHQEGARA